MKASYIKLANYVSIFDDVAIEINEAEMNKYDLKKSGFFSTIKFFEDLIKISEELKDADPKIVALRTEIRKIN